MSEKRVDLHLVVSQSAKETLTELAGNRRNRSRAFEEVMKKERKKLDLRTQGK